jgi:hypothetical protein
MALFKILKKGAPRRRGLALPRIDATLKVDLTPHPKGDRASMGIYGGRCQNAAKIAFLVTICIFDDLLESAKISLLNEN